MTDDSKLERVLDKLLPQLLRSLAQRGHRRVRAACGPQPCQQARAFGRKHAPTLTGSSRCMAGRRQRRSCQASRSCTLRWPSPARQERRGRGRAVLEGVGCRSEQHKPILLRTAVDGLAALEKEGGAAASVDRVRADFTFLRSELDKATFMAFARDCMLYAPPSARAASALDAAQAAAQAGGSAAAVAAECRANEPPWLHAPPRLACRSSTLARFLGTAGDVTERVDAVGADAGRHRHRHAAQARAAVVSAKAGMPAEVYPVALIGAEDCRVRWSHAPRRCSRSSASRWTSTAMRL